MLWTKVDHFASRMRLRETCGHHIKRTGHVGKGSVWVVVKIMGTYYHKTFVPSVSEGLVMLHLEHWIFKRVAFFFSFPFIGAGLAGCGATVYADGLIPHQNGLLWSAWKKIKQDLKVHSLLNQPLCYDTYIECQSWFLRMRNIRFQGVLFSNLTSVKLCVCVWVCVCVV